MYENVENFSDIEKALNETSLPRLQVVGKSIEGDCRNQIWDYHMVYKHFTEGVVKLPIAQQTREHAGATGLLDEDEMINPTMRISADSKWDSVQMNMPLFYIIEGKVQKIDLAEFKRTISELEEIRAR